MKKAIRNIIIGSVTFVACICFGGFMYMSSTFLPNMRFARTVLYLADLVVAIYAGFMLCYAVEYLAKKAKRRGEKLFRMLAHEAGYYARKIGF